MAVAACVFTACGYRRALHASYIPEVTDSTHYEGVRPEYQQLAALMEKDTGLPTSTGNTIAFIPDGAQKLELMLYDMDRAKESLYLDYYRICVDSAGTIVLGKLKDMAAAGMDIRVIADKAAVIPKYRRQLNTINDVGGLYKSFYKPIRLTFWFPRRECTVSTGKSSWWTARPHIWADAISRTNTT